MSFFSLIPDAQRVSIKPSGRQVKKVNSGLIFTCIIEDITEDLTPPPDIRWKGPTGSEITATVGRFVLNPVVVK